MVIVNRQKKQKRKKQQFIFKIKIVIGYIIMKLKKSSKD